MKERNTMLDLQPRTNQPLWVQCLFIHILGSNIRNLMMYAIILFLWWFAPNNQHLKTASEKACKSPPSFKTSFLFSTSKSPLPPPHTIDGSCSAAFIQNCLCAAVKHSDVWQAGEIYNKKHKGSIPGDTKHAKKNKKTQNSATAWH